mgnify:CR=1 FL=1
MLPFAAPAAPVADRCLFLHGLGVSGNVTDALFMGVAYWMKLKKVAKKLCNHTSFPVFDTVTRGAGNASLQDDFYHVAAAYQGEGDRVFTHSMGNNILARACLDQGKCLERGWFQAHGPVTGSIFPDLLHDWCPPSGAGFPERLQGWAAKLVGYCSPATYSLQTCDRSGSAAVCGGVSQLAKIGNLTRHGVMCGTSGFGLISVLSPLLGALDEFYMRPRGAAPDDGMVSLSSCTAAFEAWNDATRANASFAEVANARYYRAATNHGDGMGFDVDGIGADRKPISWFESMIRIGWRES